MKKFDILWANAAKEAKINVALSAFDVNELSASKNPQKDAEILSKFQSYLANKTYLAAREMVGAANLSPRNMVKKSFIKQVVQFILSVVKPTNVQKKSLEDIREGAAPKIIFEPGDYYYNPDESIYTGKGEDYGK